MNSLRYSFSRMKPAGWRPGLDSLGFHGFPPCLETELANYWLGNPEETHEGDPRINKILRREVAALKKRLEKK
jgi:hypothetical protein